MMPSKHLTELDASGQTSVLEIGSDILSTNVEAIRQSLLNLLEGSPTAKVYEIRMPQTRMVDSAGLNLLVWLIKAARSKGATVKIVLSNRNVLRTFQFTRLDREVEIVQVDPIAPDRRSKII